MTDWYFITTERPSTSTTDIPPTPRTLAYAITADLPRTNSSCCHHCRLRQSFTYIERPCTLCSLLFFALHDIPCRLLCSSLFSCIVQQKLLSLFSHSRSSIATLATSLRDFHPRGPLLALSSSSQQSLTVCSTSPHRSQLPLNLPR